MPFVTRGEFPIPCTRGSAARAGIGPSLQISMMGLAQSNWNVAECGGGKTDYQRRNAYSFNIVMFVIRWVV